MDPATATAIGLGAAQMGGSLVSDYYNRKYGREMYNLQRQHQLEDWHRANKYNSPVQQMQRLREAGLNPNLVYGKGGGNVPATMIRTPDAPEGQFNNPVEGIPQIYAATKMNAAALDRVQKEIENMELEGKYIDAKTAKTLGDVRLANAIHNDLVKRYHLDNNIKEAIYTTMLDKNERDKIKAADDHNLALKKQITEDLNQLYIKARTEQTYEQKKQTIQQIKNLQQLFDKIGTEIDLNKSELYLREHYNMSWDDPFIYRKLLTAPLDSVQKEINAFEKKNPYEQRQQLYLNKSKKFKTSIEKKHYKKYKK